MTIPIMLPELNPAQLDMLYKAMLGIIGEDERKMPDYNMRHDYIIIENDLKAEQRTQLAKLFGRDHDRYTAR